ncbi:MAG: iron chaperone, partial [Bryobacteraceae bacterium]
MKKANPGDRGSADVDEYLAGVPEPARSTLNKIRAAIRSAVPPEATEAISYRMATFNCNGPLLGYAAFSNHCGLYPMSPPVIEAFKNELKDFPTSKGAIRFPVDRPPPAALVRKLVKARIAESEHKK